MQISKQGYIIGGNHHKGLQYAATHRMSGNRMFNQYIRDGIIKIQTRKFGKEARIVIKKRIPCQAFTGKGELGRMRMNQMIHDYVRKGWVPAEELQQRRKSMYRNLVDIFKP